MSELRLGDTREIIKEYPEEPTIYTLEDMRGETCTD